MPQPDQRPKVTIEDLLRLKRAERPAAEFWANFEQELRQKQLTALLEKRPWWQGLPQIFARRAYLPVGATAILAFTLVSVKYYAPTQVAQLPAPASNTPVVADQNPASAQAPASSQLGNRGESAPAGTLVAAVKPTTEENSPETTELMPASATPNATERPSARLLAATNLNGLAESVSGFGQDVLSNRLSAQPHVQAAAVTVEELASVPANSTRRNRLLAHYDGRQLNPEPAPPAVVRERLARRLGETEYTDRGGRLARDIASFGTPMPQIVALRF
ncbi:MAG: hypothetical protein HYX71_11265 [Opitutae bacterium]|nr:hypothetical protein [Opitutae bacterium]